ncbi:hypothetical protein R3P38DRAFT_2800777 [Favolaschia claudopus]|uniref:Uncharacterized protein n=1 Tax=Favolaschia claudopus TaxID=2862362 RepID=A0AAV9ZWY5_9AGAR
MFHPSFTQAGATNPGNPWSQHHGFAPSQPDPQFVTPPQSTYVIPPSAPTRQACAGTRSLAKSDAAGDATRSAIPPPSHYIPQYGAPPPGSSWSPASTGAAVVAPTYRIPPLLSASGHIADLGPVPKPFSLLSSGWTDADKLALERYNWIPWSQRVKNQLGMASGAWRFLERGNPCPSFQVYPAHYRAWIDADMVVRCFLSEVCAGHGAAVF